MKGRFLGLWAAVAALVVGLSGGTGVAREPVKIGVILPYTGVIHIQAQDNTRGFELYLKQAGEKAGGRPVVLVKEDSEATPSVGLSKVRKLIERDHVDFLFGPVHAGVALAIRNTVVNNRVPWIIAQAPVRQLTAPHAMGSPYIFRLNETFDQGNVTMGRWLYKNTPYRRVIIVAADFEAGHQAAEGFKAAFQEMGGRIVKEIYPPLNTSDYAPYLAQIDPSQADAVYAWEAGADAIRFDKQYAEYGLKKKLPLYGYATLTDDVILPAVGDAALGIPTIGLYTAQLDNPANKKFVRDYEAAYGVPPSRYSETGYTGAQLILEAIRLLKGDLGHKEKTLQALREAAGKIHSPRGAVKFDRYGQVIPTMYITRTERRGKRLVNVVIDKIPDVTQESTWGWWQKKGSR